MTTHKTKTILGLTFTNWPQYNYYKSEIGSWGLHWSTARDKDGFKSRSIRVHESDGGSFRAFVETKGYTGTTSLEKTAWTNDKRSPEAAIKAAYEALELDVTEDFEMMNGNG